MKVRIIHFKAVILETIYSYAVLAPNVVALGENYVVNVLLTKESSDTGVSSAYVNASFQESDLGAWRGANVNFAARQLGGNAKLEFAIPLTLLNRRNLTLTVKSTGHITFEKRIPVSVQAIDGRIYIQMDKPMYRAGDKIRFIAFGMYNSFLPILDRAMNISIQVNC